MATSVTCTFTAAASATPTVQAVAAGALGGVAFGMVAVPQHNVVMATAFGALTSSLAAVPSVNAAGASVWGGLAGHIDATIVGQTGHVEAVMVAPLGTVTATMTAVVKHAATLTGGVSNEFAFVGHADAAIAPIREATLVAALALTGRAVATIIPPALPAPAPSGNAGWYQLLSILGEMRDEHQQEVDRVPDACPNDGEPLQAGPEGRGILYCPYDGWQYPRDHVRPA